MMALMKSNWISLCGSSSTPEMQTQLKYNKQASLKVTWALSYENSIPEAAHSLYTGVVNWVEIFTVAVCMISTFQHQLGLMESTCLQSGP